MNKLTWTAAVLVLACAGAFAATNKPIKAPVLPPLPRRCPVGFVAGSANLCVKPLPIPRPIGGPVPRLPLNGSGFSFNETGNGGAVTTSSAFVSK